MKFISYDSVSFILAGIAWILIIYKLVLSIKESVSKSKTQKSVLVLNQKYIKKRSGLHNITINLSTASGEDNSSDESETEESGISVKVDNNDVSDPEPDTIPIPEA